MPFLSAATAIHAGFAALRTNPLRTFLSALGVVIGIGAMISVLALSDGVEASIRKQLAADGRVLSLRVEPRTTEVVDGLTLPRTGFPFFSSSDAEQLERFVGTAGTTDLTVTGPAFLTAAEGRKQRAVMLRGMRLTPQAVRDRPPVAGRFFTPAEAQSGAHVLVLTDGLAALLASTLADSGTAAQPARVQPTAAACRALVGREVRMGAAPWQIIGLLPPNEDTPTECSGAPAPAGRPGSRRGGAPGARLTFAVVPTVAALSAIVPLPGRPISTSLLLSANRVEALPALRSATERWLATRFSPPTGAFGGWKDEVDIVSYERESESIRQGMLVFRLLMSAITGISLVVGGVGIMNVLLATVTERTREIGISKAVGARRRDVLVQYLAESVAIAAMGAVLGTALGYGVAQIVAVVMRRQATIPVHAGFSLSTMLVAVGAPLVVGLCFGMYPALRASRLSPIDAIRHE